MAVARIKPQNALKLAAWLYTQHPKLFRVILNQTQKLQASPLGRLGWFGDDGDLSVTPDPSVDSSDMPTITVYGTADTSGADLSNLTLDSMNSPLDTSIAVDTGSPTSAVGFTPSAASLSPVTDAIAAPPASTDTPVDTSSSSGSFWSSIASGAGSVAGAVGKVASAFLAPQTLAAAAGAAGAYFRAQAQTAQTNAQAQIVQAQLARTAAGYAPAPISYYTNPVTGQVTPVYASNTGYQPVTSGLLNSLLYPSTAGGISPIVWIGGGALLLIALVSLSARKG